MSHKCQHCGSEFETVMGATAHAGKCYKNSEKIVKPLDNNKLLWEEWSEMLKVILNFYSLSDEQKSQILLMMDGLKYRKLKEDGNIQFNGEYCR